MKNVSNYDYKKIQNQSKPIQVVPAAPVIVENVPPIANPEPHSTIIESQKITEYKMLIADSYHSVEKVANELLTLGYEVKQVIPVISGKIVLLGGK